MRTTLKNVLLAAGLAGLAAPVVAQETSIAADPKAPTHKSTAEQGKKHPQRIASGVHTGKRTAGEAASLERKETGLNAEDRDMHEDNRGRLTSANRAQLQHRQNHVSKAIHHDKHNATVASAHAKNAAGPHAQRHHPAELKTGQLTTRQAAHLETKEAALHHEIHSDREPDGTLTPEDQKTTRQQNKNTNEIHLKKHNARMF